MQNRCLLVSLALAAVLAGTISCSPDQKGEPAAGAASSAETALFTAKFKDFDRTFQPLQQWRGRPMLIYFWATWCEPCRNEVPELIRTYAKYQDKDLMIVGIAVDQTDKVQAFTKEFGITYPVLIGGNDALALSRQLGNGVGGLPFLVAVSRDGRVAGTHIGELSAGQLEELVTPLVS